MCKKLQHVTALILFALLFATCKKNAVAKPQPVVAVNDIIETQPPVLTPVTTAVSDVIGGFYAGLPVHYTETTKNYPLLIFIHGGGQVGNGKLDLPLVLNDGITQLLDAKIFPPNFKVDGKNFSFIVLAPQFSQYPSNEQVAFFMEYARQHFRVDTTRVYMTGLSMGGIVTADMGAQYTNKLAAIVPMSGVFAIEGSEAKCRNIAEGNLPVWVFHNDQDPSLSPTGPLNFIALINSFNPTVIPKLTMFTGIYHDAWTRAINPTYKEQNLNIYEWMLHYNR